MTKLESVQKYQNALTLLKFGGVGYTQEEYIEAIRLFQDLIDQIPTIARIDYEDSNNENL